MMRLKIPGFVASNTWDVCCISYIQLTLMKCLLKTAATSLSDTSSPLHGTRTCNIVFWQQGRNEFMFPSVDNDAIQRHIQQ